MKIIKSSTTDKIDHTVYGMYPSRLDLLTGVNVSFKIPDYSTVYGYVVDGSVFLGAAPGGPKLATSGEYFSLPDSADATEPVLSVNGSVALFTRFGFIGQRVLGGPIEESGRLVYIDNCSDSLLIYPPRRGDPSLNSLHFPVGVDQTFHIHPSVRLGVVAKGSGFACTKDSEEVLNTGDAFCIDERELHRFRTVSSSMTVIAFHPDGDWGPTDSDHVMLNRTYLGTSK